MSGRRLAGFAALVLLSACNEDRRSTDASAPAPAPLSAAAELPAAGLAYRHELRIATTAAGLGDAFAAARDRCLTDAALACRVLSAEIDVGGGERLPGGSLTVRLAHAGVGPFERAILSGPGTPVLRSRSTSAEDLAPAIADTERRRQQATDYRERLLALAARTDSKVDDLIKLAAEISRVQTELEAAAAQQEGFKTRVETEVMAVTLTASETPPGAWGPVRTVWRNGAVTFAESTAAALGFLIASVPWVPVLVLTVILARWLVRLRRRAQA